MNRRVKEESASDRMSGATRTTKDKQNKDKTHRLMTHKTDASHGRRQNSTKHSHYTPSHMLVCVLMVGYTYIYEGKMLSLENHVM